MELQSRPEALAVELARHQVGGPRPQAGVGAPGTGVRRPAPCRRFCLTGGAWKGGGSFFEPAPGVGEMGTCRTPFWAPPLPSSCAILHSYFCGGGGRSGPVGPEPGVFCFSIQGLHTEGAGRGPLLELAPGCVRVCARPPAAPTSLQSCTVCESSFGDCCSACSGVAAGARAVLRRARVCVGEIRTRLEYL